jgi:hypothetical protein
VLRSTAARIEANYAAAINESDGAPRA